MKYIIYTFYLLIILFIVYEIYCYITVKPCGRDTSVAFGDATYQILKGTNEDGKQKYDLYKYHSYTVLNYVYKYKDDPLNRVAYFVGKDDYEGEYYFVIVDYKNYKEEKYTCDTLGDYYSYFINNIDNFDKLKNNFLVSDNICDGYY